MSGEDRGLEVAIRVSRRDFLLDVSFDLEAGRRLAVVGPSGAGKTPLLRAVAGLIRPDSGSISIGKDKAFDSEAGVDLPPEARRCAYVPQDYALFPHLTATANVSFGMPNRHALNGAFLPMAMMSGMTCAIMDTRTPLIVDAVKAADLMLGRDDWGMTWIARARAAAAAAPGS